MKEEDIEDLKIWLIQHDYYIGCSAVAKSLRDLADWWED